VAREAIELVEIDESLRDELVAYVEEFRAAGEPSWQNEREAIRSDFAGYVRRRRDSAAGRNLPEGLVPQTDYFLWNGHQIVGSIRLRHQLTPALANDGGNIGYEVRPSRRGEGHATRMLAMILDKARQVGLKRVLLTCHNDNPASARVIDKNGGRLASQGISKRDGKEIRRYWIEL
jgi:predicted acetyltransferase